MDSPLVAFLSGMLAGSAVVVGAFEAYVIVRRRRYARDFAKRLMRAQAVAEMLAAATENQPTVGCECAWCVDKRKVDAVAKGVN